MLSAKSAAPCRFVGLRRVAAAAPSAPSVAARRPGAASLQVRAAVVAEPATLEVKGTDGSSKGTASLALRVAEDGKAKGLVHRYLVTVRQNARQGTASTKTRSEVRGGGRKPIKQKGTGNARQGSTRTPLRPGGGVIFGPKPKDWSVKMNQKERKLAMATALQSAACDMTVCEDLAGKFEDRKTKSMVAAMSAMGVDVMSEHTLLLTNGKNDDAYMAGRNIERLCIADVAIVNVYDVLRADKVVVEEAAMAFINDKYAA